MSGLTVTMKPVRCGAYCRVSTRDQEPENQARVLRAYAELRGWQATMFVDRGESGAKDRRPALDAMLTAARRRRLDVILVTKLDRLARSVRHLVNLAAEFEALGVNLVCCDQPGLDTTIPSGKLLFHILGSIAEFERALTTDRIHSGIARARAQGKHLGRPKIHHVDVARAVALRAQGHSWRATARALGVHVMAVRRALSLSKSSPVTAA